MQATRPPNHIARQAGMSARSKVSGWQGLSWLRVVARRTFRHPSYLGS